MSTKIYTGFRVAHNNPALLMKQLKSLQGIYTERAKGYLSGVLSIGALLDDEKAIQAQIDIHYEEKLMADIIIYFKKDKIIGTYFIRDRDLEKAFRRQKWFRDYHYQNQTDHDTKITEKEWKQRERDWEFLSIPANDGFTFYLVNPADIKPFSISWYRNDLEHKIKAAQKGGV